MDPEKIVSGLIGGAVTGVIAIGSALVAKGKREEQFDAIRNNVATQTTEMKDLEKRIDDKVSMALFKDEINEIHGRISRTQREQDESMTKLTEKVDRLSEGVFTIHGMMTNLPAQIREAVAKGNQ